MRVPNGLLRSREMLRSSILALVAFAGGCAPMPAYICGSKLGHPTMTAEEISIGSESRVRAVTEGATGGLGGPAVATAK